MGLNEFKFRCVDCGACQILHRGEMLKKCKPNCRDCGSTFLEAATTRGQSVVVMGHSAHRDQQNKMYGDNNKRIPHRGSVSDGRHRRR